MISFRVCWCVILELIEIKHTQNTHTNMINNCNSHNEGILYDGILTKLRDRDTRTHIFYEGI